jgi:hypothetical protein
VSARVSLRSKCGNRFARQRYSRTYCSNNCHQKRWKGEFCGRIPRPGSFSAFNPAKFIRFGNSPQLYLRLGFEYRIKYDCFDNWMFGAGLALIAFNASTRTLDSRLQLEIKTHSCLEIRARMHRCPAATQECDLSYSLSRHLIEANLTGSCWQSNVMNAERRFSSPTGLERYASTMNARSCLAGSWRFAKRIVRSVSCWSSSTYGYSSHGRRRILPARSIKQSTMSVSLSGNNSGKSSAIQSRSSISASPGSTIP